MSLFTFIYQTVSQDSHLPRIAHKFNISKANSYNQQKNNHQQYINMNYYTKAIILLLAVASIAADSNQLIEDTSTKSISTADKILQVLKGESSLFGDTSTLVNLDS